MLKLFDFTQLMHLNLNYTVFQNLCKTIHAYKILLKAKIETCVIFRTNGETGFTAQTAFFFN